MIFSIASTLAIPKEFGVLAPARAQVSVDELADTEDSARAAATRTSSKRGTFTKAQSLDTDATMLPSPTLDPPTLRYRTIWCCLTQLQEY